MKGATAGAVVNVIKSAERSKTTIIGKNANFL
jgi:hypothetical protein